MFVDDSSEEDFNPDCECDETPGINVDLDDAVQIQDESPQASATCTKTLKAGKKKVCSKKRALSKAERKSLKERLQGVDLQLLWHQITCKLNETVVSENDSDSKSKEDSFSSNSTCIDNGLVAQVLSASTADNLDNIVVHLRDLFIYLYSKYDGPKSKDKYCAFQLEWHKHCSAFLLDSTSSMDDIGLPVSENKDLARSCADWVKFCDKAGVNQESRNRVMMVMCAAVYNFLLQRVSQFIKEEIVGEQSANNATSYEDSDDVLYRFCGAALASMLHSRYKLIRTCPLERKDAVSMEISLLQSVNSKEKSHIPNYLQYRDRGFMYFPSESFLPFLRAVDKSVKKYTNPDCFQHHGSQLVEVSIYLSVYI